MPITGPILAWTARNATLVVRPRGGDASVVPGTSVHSPAGAIFGARLFLGWTDQQSALRLAVSDDADAWSALPEPRETATLSPALATFGKAICLAWTGTDGRLNAKLSANGGGSWSPRSTLSETSVRQPAVAAFTDLLWLAWTGDEDKKRINLISSADGTNWHDKQTLDQASPDGPALAAFLDHLYLAWRGTDDRINLIASRNGTDWGDADKITFDFSTVGSPPLASDGSSLFLAWTTESGTIDLIWSADGVQWSSPTSVADATDEGPAIVAGALSSRITTVPRFAAQAIAAPELPQNPHLASNGRNNMHNDSYMSDAYAWRGPEGGRMQLRFGALPGLCPTLTFDQLGQIVTVCSYRSADGRVTRQLLRIDGDSLTVLASYTLPSGPGGGSTFGGGGYIYLDNDDQAVVPTADQQIMIFGSEVDGDFVLRESFGLRGAIGNDTASVQSAMPDWRGLIWWVADNGVVGYVDPHSRAIQQHLLGNDEQIGNSFAIDETGGVYVVSTCALYRFDLGEDGAPTVTWRCAYDRGSRQKPGQTNFGSGTTPTLVGESYVAICDNADPQMHVVVFHRERDFAGNRQVCAQPVFPPSASATENSLIGYNDVFIVENNYNYTGTSTCPTNPVTPGVVKITFSSTGGASTINWDNQQLVIPSVVSKLSLASGLLYTYSLEIVDGRQDWSITAVDAVSGRVAFTVLAGSGLSNDNHYASFFIGPQGTAYVSVWSGLFSLKEL